MTKGVFPIEAYLSHFNRFESSLGEDANGWIHGLRRRGLARFSELGFPGTKLEEWRFTNVAPLVSTSFEPVALEDPEGRTGQQERRPEGLDDLTVGDWSRSRLVFVNGSYRADLSLTGPLPGGVMVLPLAEALASHREKVEPHLVRRIERSENAFAALNLAFLAHGTFIFLPKGCVPDEPIHIVFVTAANGSPIVTHPYNLIVADAGSEAKVVESYGGTNGQVYFTNAVTDVVAGDNAVIDHYRIQRESRDGFHVASVGLHQGRSSMVTNHSISLGGRLARNDITVVLDGEGSESALNGLYAVGGRQHVDHHTVIDHAKPHCSSRELYKGILDDRARAVFNGRIIVRPDAQKTDARQTNKNLILSDHALVNTNPQLEINADDVKCSHGATIGQLDAEALFYLRSRGIDRDAARNLLVYGFMSELTGRIRIDAVRSSLEKILTAELPRVV